MHSFISLLLAVFPLPFAEHLSECTNLLLMVVEPAWAVVGVWEEGSRDLMVMANGDGCMRHSLCFVLLLLTELVWLVSGTNFHDNHVVYVIVLVRYTNSPPSSSWLRQGAAGPKISGTILRYELEQILPSDPWVDFIQTCRMRMRLKPDLYSLS